MGLPLSFPVLIASFVLLALWMSRLRSAMTARGETLAGPPAVEWWGWFVPLANFVLPFLGMRASRARRAGLGVLRGLVGHVLPVLGLSSRASQCPTFTAIDFSTGELTQSRRP